MYIVVYRMIYRQLASESPVFARDVFLFNTFFFRKCVQDGVASTKKWTRGCDIFVNKRFVVIPIHAPCARPIAALFLTHVGNTGTWQ